MSNIQLQRNTCACHGALQSAASLYRHDMMSINVQRGRPAICDSKLNIFGFWTIGLTKQAI